MVSALLSLVSQCLTYDICICTCISEFDLKLYLNLIYVWQLKKKNLFLLFRHWVQCDYFVTPWTVAHQAPLSLRFPRQEYWDGLLFRFLRDLPDWGIEPGSRALQADSLPSEPPGRLQVQVTHTKIFWLLPFILSFLNKCQHTGLLAGAWKLSWLERFMWEFVFIYNSL